MMEFHISRKARERYQFAESLFSYNGNVVFANMAACRAFAHQMNQVREVDKHPERAVHAGAAFCDGADRRGQPRADGALSRAVRSGGDDHRAGLVCGRVGRANWTRCC